MLSPSYDRTWPLRITIENAAENKEADPGAAESLQIRVRGDYTIGYVMAKISETLEDRGPKQGWSDYALWWSERKKWLKQCRRTLDQEDVIANTNLHFTSMHKALQVQLPDLTISMFRVDFSVNILHVVSDLCNEMEIAHHEEFSLMRPLTKDQLKKNNPNLEASPLQRPYGTLSKTMSRSTLGNSDTDTLTNGHINGNGTTLKNGGTLSSNGSIHGSNNSLAISGMENRSILLPHPKTAEQKARLNKAWLNSSISLYEQDVCENDLLLLSVKFYSFENLHIGQLARINYIYEHLRWKILREEITCTEDEMYTLAGIMWQVTISSGAASHNSNLYLTQKSHDSSISNHSHQKTNGGMNGNGYGNHHYANIQDNGHHNGHHSNGNHRLQVPGADMNNGSSSISDEVDSALESLERDLLGTSLHSNHPYGNANGGRPSNGNVDHLVPLEQTQMVAQLKIICQKVKTSTSTLARTLKLVGQNEKSYYVVLRDLTMKAFRVQGFNITFLTSNDGKPPIFDIHLTNCEVKPDVLVSQSRYCFKIIDSTPKDTMEYTVRCPDHEHYAKWYEACKLASRGYTITHPSYLERFQETMKRLQIQSKLNQNTYRKKDLKEFNIEPSDYIAPRFLKRRSKDQLVAKIKAANEAFKTCSSVRAQMEFIQTCQTLKDYGITLFEVRMHKSKITKDMLGVMPDRLVLIDINNGALKKCWRYKTMIDWNINWDVKRMTVNFKDETIVFECPSIDCKVIHEFIGGYIYMSMRSQNPNAGFNEEQFLKLTGGWNDEIEDEERMPNSVRFSQTNEWS